MPWPDEATDGRTPDGDRRALGEDERPAPAHREPEARSSADPSIRRGLAGRIVRTSIVGALVGAAFGAFIGLLFDGAGLAVGLGIAFALAALVIAGLMPSEREDGLVDDDVARHSP